MIAIIDGGERADDSRPARRRRPRASGSSGLRAGAARADEHNPVVVDDSDDDGDGDDDCLMGMPRSAAGADRVPKHVNADVRRSLRPRRTRTSAPPLQSGSALRVRRRAGGTKCEASRARRLRAVLLVQPHRIDARRVPELAGARRVRDERTRA